ncbi:MAG TPA: CaiB/BaiF CoA-transferase family protein [Dehalococcoidia bacterium]|nr:CaiB/BaiF CoA-transferase family protein [Dehalococcoidia bacterium]
MLPLEGIRVLDLSRLAPGPFCSMLLGDMGADILMIEAPPSRLPGASMSNPRPSGDDAQRMAAYNALSRNKKSMILNLQEQKARDIFYELAKSADVVLEGFRPGVVKRLGVDYDTLRGINDRIVYCSLSGYGQDGPYVGLVGHDINYISIGGALGMIGWPGGPPAIPMNVIADFAGGGLHAAYGILLALMARQKTGKGQYVDIAMSDGVLQLISTMATMYFSSGTVPGRGTHMLNGALPNYNVYECRDGKWISLGSLEPHFFANLCRVMGREDLIEHQHNAEKFPEMRQHFAEQFRTKDRAEWFRIMQETDICVGPVYTIDEALSDPHNLHRKMVVEVDAPGVGKVKQVGISVKLSETPGAVRSSAPLQGQHTDEVMSSLGYSSEQIRELREAGIVG